MSRPEIPQPTESQVQAAILQMLAYHPRVGWSHRMNVGGGWYGDDEKPQFVKFAFKGCSDIIGQMKTGQFLAIECKSPKGQPTEAQVEFIRKVLDNGGVAGIARSVDDALAILGGEE